MDNADIRTWTADANGGGGERDGVHPMEGTVDSDSPGCKWVGCDGL